MAGSFGQFVAKHGFSYGFFSMVAGLAFVTLLIGTPWDAGVRSPILIAILAFWFGLVVFTLASLRWLILRMSWGDKVWGYSSAEAHELLSVKDSD